MYSEELSVTNEGEGKTFPKKLREFITTRLALQEMLMVVAHVETKEHGYKNIKISKHITIYSDKQDIKNEHSHCIKTTNT